MKDYFNSIAELLHADSSTASFGGHKPDIGSNREEILINVLNNHLPDCLTAINGGTIINLQGDRSGQIDVIIKNHSFPKFEQHKKTTVIAESVAGVISVKSHLDKNSLIDAIENVATIPKFSEESLSLSNSSLIRQGLQEQFFEYWPYRVIFAYDGIDPDTIYQHAKAYYNENKARLAQFPTMIVINKSICIRYLPDGGKLHDGTKLPPRYMNPLTLTPKTQGYPIAGIITEINNYVPWMKWMKFNFSPYIDKAYTP